MAAARICLMSPSWAYTTATRFAALSEPLEVLSNMTPDLPLHILLNGTAQAVEEVQAPHGAGIRHHRLFSVPIPC